MITANKSNRRPDQDDLLLQLIEVITDALTKLMRTVTSTMVALGILVILAAIILQAASEVQQQVVPLLTGMLGVIIGRILAQGDTSLPKPPEMPGPSE